jgi:biopolymer transport protein ExbD
VPPPIETEPPGPERALPESIFSDPTVPEPVARSPFDWEKSRPESTLQESVVPHSAPQESTLLESASAGLQSAPAGLTLSESTLPPAVLAELKALPDTRHEKVATVPRRVVRTPRAEPSLVPPYKKLDVEEMIDMTAMVDIVFFLLIFFLVTSMHALDSTIPMPVPDPQKGAVREPKSVAAMESDDNFVVVRIDRNDKISVDGSEVRSDRELLFKLRDLRLSSAHPEKLLVVGHGDATHGTVVMVLDTGRELGMDQVKLTMQDEAE